MEDQALVVVPSRVEEHSSVQIMVVAPVWTLLVDVAGYYSVVVGALRQALPSETCTLHQSSVYQHTGEPQGSVFVYNPWQCDLFLHSLCIQHCWSHWVCLDTAMTCEHLNHNLNIWDHRFL